jgi:hypothetical protein
MFAVRYVLPIGLVLLGIALYVIDPKSAGLEGLTMSIGAAIAVLVLNLLFRMGVEGDRDREREAAAREHFAQYGRWPGE